MPIYNPSSSGVLGPFATLSALIASYPPGLAYAGRIALIGAAAPFATYRCDGVVWQDTSAVTVIPFDTSIPFTYANADMGIKYLDGPLTFTINPTGASRNTTTSMTVVGNGVVTPLFDVGFLQDGNNAGFNSGAGIVNELIMRFNGLQYYYAWMQSLAPVAVGSPDTAPPTVSSAQVTNAARSVIALQMSEVLAGSPPAASAFAVSGGKTVTGVAYAGSVINLTVNTPYANGDVITASYTKPGSGTVIQDVAGNQTANFSTSVTNNIAAADATPPTLTSATVADASPTVVNLLFSEAMDQTSIPAASAFAIAGHTISAVAFASATACNLTVTPAFVNGEAARTLAYTQPGTGNLKDLAGNLLANVASLAVTNNVSASDTTPPTPQGAQVAAANTSKIIMVFSEPLVTGVPAISAFTAAGKTITGVALNGGNLEITVDTPYAANAQITLAYTQPGTGRLQDAAGNFVASFSARYISNNVLGGGDPVTVLVNTSGVTSQGDDTLGRTYFGSVGGSYIADQWGTANKSFPAGAAAEVHGQLVGYVTGEAIPNISMDTVNAPDIFANTLCTIASNGSGNYNIKENGVGIAGNVVASRAIANGDKYGIFRDGAGQLSARVSSDGGATWTTLHNYSGPTTAQLFILLQMTNTCGISNMRGAGLL
jgi:hypothetical protein